MNTVPLKFLQDTVDLLSVSSIRHLAEIVDYCKALVRDRIFHLKAYVMQQGTVLQTRNLYDGEPVRRAEPRHCRGIWLFLYKVEMTRSTLRQLLQAQPYCHEFYLRLNVTDLSMDSISVDGKEFLIKKLVAKECLRTIDTDGRFGDPHNSDARTRNLNALLPVLLQPQFIWMPIDVTHHNKEAIYSMVNEFVKKNDSSRVHLERRIGIVALYLSVKNAAYYNLQNSELW
uniref:F-box domain-containing protein n=1 Tax=Steinernema glaseri TaxID=37863 RepID=A0A1I7ZEW7_9BILA